LLEANPQTAARPPLRGAPAPRALDTTPLPESASASTTATSATPPAENGEETEAFKKMSEAEALLKKRLEESVQRISKMHKQKEKLQQEIARLISSS